VCNSDHDDEADINKIKKEFKLSAKRRAELLVSAKILDEDGNYHKDFFSKETIEKNKTRKEKQ
jgi:hypothetical protein